MIQWDHSEIKGAFDRYEILLFPLDEGWAFAIWVRKTLVEKLTGFESKSQAQIKAQEVIDRLFRDVRKLEQHLYEASAEDDIPLDDFSDME